MASEGECLNLVAFHDAVRLFTLSNTKTSVDQNLCHAHTHHESFLCQWVVEEDSQELGHVLDVEHKSMERLIEEK